MVVSLTSFTLNSWLQVSVYIKSYPVDLNYLHAKWMRKYKQTEFSFGYVQIYSSSDFTKIKPHIKKTHFIIKNSSPLMFINEGFRIRFKKTVKPSDILSFKRASLLLLCLGSVILL